MLYYLVLYIPRIALLGIFYFYGRKRRFWEVIGSLYLLIQAVLYMNNRWH